MHYTRSKSAQDATTERIEARNSDVEKARKFLGLNLAPNQNQNQNQNQNTPDYSPEGMKAKRFLLTKSTVNGQKHIELSDGTANVLNSKKSRGVLGDASVAAGKTDYAATGPGLVNPAQGVKWINGQSQSALGAGLGITNAATGIIGTLSSAQETMENWKDATRGEQASGVIDIAGNVSKSVGGAAELLSNAGVEQLADVAPGAEAVTGLADIATGGRKVVIGARQFSNMRDFKDEYAEDETAKKTPLTGMSEDAKKLRVLNQSAEQGEEEGERLIGEGAGKTITGALDATAGILGASGVGLPVAAGLKFASAASKFGFAVANHMQKKKMKEMVTKQTTGIDDQTIRAFMEKHEIKDYSRAKQALMKALGYESGYRAELYADQTKKRGKYLA
ncbi:MAG: hypothetical protein LIO42_05135 [Oscillospiraceae bacterium]|nr:hypothetical protein [Oscillospiraceae bacterium]